MRLMNASSGMALLALGLCVGGCASNTPMRFYTLTAMGAGAADDTPPTIQVARVTLPGEIDRSELVQRIDATRLNLAEQDQWAAPLAEMIRRTLSADLQARLSGGPSQSSPTPSSPTSDADSLYVDIEEFIADAKCTVTLRAAWSLKPANTAMAAKRGHETIRVDPAGSCEVSALPEAMSRALDEFSGRVVSGRMK